MSYRIKNALFVIIFLFPVLAVAKPFVSGSVIAWPADDWYQVMTEDGRTSLCDGTQFCDVPKGRYLVINHSTGERFTGVEVTVSSASTQLTYPTNSGDIIVHGNTLTFPNTNWFQVMDTSGRQSYCDGAAQCTVEAGDYLVVNHTSGERINNVKVLGSPQSATGDVVVNSLQVIGNTLYWPNNGWYQVLNESHHQPVCEGGTHCTVEPGSYLVVNHTTGQRFEHITVGQSDQPTNNPSNNPVVSIAQVNTSSGFNDSDYQGGLDLSSINLPINGIAVGEYDLVNAYPNLKFEEALYVADVPNESKLVVVEQNGRVKVFNDQSSVSSSRTILDIRDKIVFSGEQGVLGFAFDPQFPSNRYVYVYYTTENPDKSVVSRFTWNASSDQLERNTELEIISVAQPFDNHNAGMIDFGPDGYLYIALGDGGNGGDPYNNAQDVRTLLGSILRIDVKSSSASNRYNIPQDNPFVGVTNARPEIYAYGLRNPFRFSFDRVTGELWAGDVGQGELEEIDKIVKGGNYGWRVYEGTRENENALNNLPASAFIPPIHEYQHDKGLAVIGGYVYRGARLPSLNGQYLYTDFYTGTIWALQANGQKLVSNKAIATANNPTSFGETKDGDVLVVSRYGGLFKLVHRGAETAAPSTLSETGVFSDLNTLEPIHGFVAYEPKVGFWSDGATKQRWIGIPKNTSISFSHDQWVFPVGSVAIKHFEMELDQGSPESTKRLETRIMLYTEQGWQGYSYRWNSAGTDALFVAQSATETLTLTNSAGQRSTQQYEYPSSSECKICHQAEQRGLLGLSTPQLNYVHNSNNGKNQLKRFESLNLFDRDVGDTAVFSTLEPLSNTSAGTEVRARSYLDVNCSYCHNGGGTSPSNMDLRAQTTLTQTHTVNQSPTSGTLGLTNPKLIAPGSKEQSILWRRLSTNNSERMPPLGTHVLDTEAVQLIGRWIDSM